MEFNNSRQIIIFLTLLEVRRPITSDKLYERVEALKRSNEFFNRHASMAV